MRLGQAFKEWAVIVDALVEGRQAIVFRKGGIHDPGGLFSPGPKDFFLFPTYEHQNAADLVPAERPRLERVLAAMPPKGQIVFRGFAVVHSYVKITDEKAMKTLFQHQILGWDALIRRFEWGGEKGVFALLLRVYRLREPVRVSDTAAYSGCKSLVSLEKEIDVDGYEPAMAEMEFLALGEVFHSVSQG